MKTLHYTKVILNSVCSQINGGKTSIFSISCIINTFEYLSVAVVVEGSSVQCISCLSEAGKFW